MNIENESQIEPIKTFTMPMKLFIVIEIGSVNLIQENPKLCSFLFILTNDLVNHFAYYQIQSTDIQLNIKDHYREYFYIRLPRIQFQTPGIFKDLSSNRFKLLKSISMKYP